MVDCDKVKEYISDYIEKRLSPTLKNELDDHFKVCSACKVILDRIPKIQSMMLNLNQVKCSDDFSLKLRNRIINNNDDQVISKVTIKRVSYAFSFAAVILILVFSFNFFNQTEPQNIKLPQVNNKEVVKPSNPVNQNIKQASANLTQTEELNVRTKEGEGIYTDSTKNKSPEEKDPRVKYVDSK